MILKTGLQKEKKNKMFTIAQPECHGTHSLDTPASECRRLLTHKSCEVERYVSLLLEAVHVVLQPLVEYDGQDETNKVEQCANLSDSRGQCHTATTTGPHLRNYNGGGGQTQVGSLPTGQLPIDNFLIGALKNTKLF